MLFYIVLFIVVMACSVIFLMGSGLVPFFIMSLTWSVYLIIKIINYFIKKPVDITEKIFVYFHFCLIIFILALIPFKFKYAYSLDRKIKMLNYHAISAYCYSFFPSIIEKGESAVDPLAKILAEYSDKGDNYKNLINNAAFCLSKIKGESFVEEMGIRYENPCERFAEHY